GGPAAQLGWFGRGDGAGEFRCTRADRANEACGWCLEFLDLADKLVDVGARIAQRPRVRAQVEVQRGESDDSGRSLLSSFARRPPGGGIPPYPHSKPSAGADRSRSRSCWIADRQPPVRWRIAGSA